LEDFQLFSISRSNTASTAGRPLKRRPTNGGTRQLHISNPRHSTFRRLSQSATNAFHATLGGGGNAESNNANGPFYALDNKLSNKAGTTTPTQPAHPRPRERERVTVLLQRGQAPALEMRFSALDMPEAETIAQSVTSRPLSAIWFSSPFSLSFPFNGRGSGAGAGSSTSGSKRNANGNGNNGDRGWSLPPRSAPAWSVGGSSGAWTGLNDDGRVEATTTGYEYQQYLAHGHIMGRRANTPSTPTSARTGTTNTTVPGAKGPQNEALWISGLRDPDKDKGKGKGKDKSRSKSGSNGSLERRTKSVGAMPYPFAAYAYAQPSQSQSQSHLTVDSPVGNGKNAAAHESYRSSKSGMSASMMSWSVMNDFPPVPVVPSDVAERYEEKMTTMTGAGGKRLSGDVNDPFNDPESRLE
jgi:hypothetical protein